MGIQKVLKALEEEKEKLEQTVLSGGVHSLETYRSLLGKISAYREVILLIHKECKEFL